MTIVSHPLARVQCSTSTEIGAIGGDCNIPLVKRLTVIVIETRDSDGVPMRMFYTDDGLLLGREKWSPKT